VAVNLEKRHNMPSKFAPVPKFAPGRVAPQAARYWPGKRLEEDKESSDEYDSEEEEEAEEEQVEQEPAQRQPPPKEKVPEAGTKLITTMRSASIAEEGPYQPPEEDSSEEESEEEEDAAQPEKRKLRQATKRATGGFHATDLVDLEEEEEEVLSDCGVADI
jgi:formate dehydrogenase assembly factor FdhD